MTLFWFLLALFILIGIHEFGHFIVARFCGVKVLRFSFGFGKVLGSWRDKKGTEYAISLIPLGGYVKMLDETVEPVPKNETHLAFNNKSVLQRICIVLAGPVFNLLFAVLCFWLVLIIGTKSIAPILEGTEPGSLAAKAGFQRQDEILQVNNTAITSWQDFQYALMPFMGTKANLSVQVKSMPGDRLRTLNLPLENWQLASSKIDLLTSLGLIPFIPKIPSLIGDVIANSPAAEAGITAGDKIESFDGKILNDWTELVTYVQLHPNKTIRLAVLHQGSVKNLSLVIGSQDGKNGKQVGFLGLRSKPVEWPQKWLRLQRQDPLTALSTAMRQTVELTSSTFLLFGRLVTGKLSFQTLTGPVGIAEGAGLSASWGFAYYLSFLGLVSVSLGALNLLPIPILDGGHLLYYLIEIIRRRPLSIRVQSIGFYFGLFFLGGMMCISLFNDIYKLAG